MPQFVVLTHDFPMWHWDFMLEQNASLRTWRLLGDPASGVEVAAEPLADHRLAYLDYEGPLSGNRGRVARWDRGEYAIQEERDDRLVLRLRGNRLRGEAVLQFRVTEREDVSGPARWSFQFTPAAGAPEPGI